MVLRVDLLEPLHLTPSMSREREALHPNRDQSRPGVIPEHWRISVTLRLDPRAVLLRGLRDSAAAFLLRVGQVLEQVGEIVGRFKLRRVAGLDLDWFDAKDVLRRPDHALCCEHLIVPRIDER